MSGLVLCEVHDGLRPSEASVGVEDVGRGGRQFLCVPRDFLSYKNGSAYLPVWVVEDDPGDPRVLVELPHEADSGWNRLWVKREHLRYVSAATTS